MQIVGFVGWRGLVGSVLMQRMLEEKDLEGLETRFFSTSNAGGAGPIWNGSQTKLEDAFNIQQLSACDAIITCQGGSYTDRVYGQLRDSGWDGYWIDAASSLRMVPDSTIVLDPVNACNIEQRLHEGCKLFVGGNCTVSLLLMALAGLFKEGLVEWVSSMTYQAISGAGARQMEELLAQMSSVGLRLGSRPAFDALEVDKLIHSELNSADFPCSEIGAPLMFNLLPWIDKAVDGGQTREEWKGFVEANKILGSSAPIPVDGICVRVGVLRCHSQAFLLKLKKDIPIAEVEQLLSQAHSWVSVVPNDKTESFKRLTPAAISGGTTVAVGRLHKARMGDNYLQGFTVGDQLLWGAAEPLRRMVRILRERQ